MVAIAAETKQTVNPPLGEVAPAGIPVIDHAKLVDPTIELLDPQQNGAILTEFQGNNDPTVPPDAQYLLSAHIVNSKNNSTDIWHIYLDQYSNRVKASLTTEDPMIPVSTSIVTAGGTPLTVVPKTFPPTTRDILPSEEEIVDRFTQTFLQRMIIRKNGMAFIPVDNHYESIDFDTEVNLLPQEVVPGIRKLDPQIYPFTSLPFVTRIDTQYKQSWDHTQHLWERVQQGLEQRRDQEFTRAAQVVENDMCARGLQLTAHDVKEQLIDVLITPKRQFQTGIYINEVVVSRDANNKLQTEIRITGVASPERFIITSNGYIKWEEYIPRIQSDGTVKEDWGDAVGDTLNYVDRLRLLKAKDAHLNSSVEAFVFPIDAQRSCVVANVNIVSGAQELFPGATDTQTVHIFTDPAGQVLTHLESSQNRMTNPWVNTQQLIIEPSSRFERTFYQGVLSEVAPAQQLTFKQLLRLYKDSAHFQDAWTTAQQEAETFYIREAIQQVMMRIQTDFQDIITINDTERDKVITNLSKRIEENRKTPPVQVPGQTGIMFNLVDPTHIPEQFGNPKDPIIYINWNCPTQTDWHPEVDSIELRADTGLAFPQTVTPYDAIIAYNLGKFLKMASNNAKITHYFEDRIALAFPLPSPTQPAETLVLIPSLATASTHVLKKDPAGSFVEKIQTGQGMQERPLVRTVQTDRVFELVAAVVTGQRDKTTLNPIPPGTTAKPIMLTNQEVQHIINIEPQLWAREQIDAKVRAFATHLGWNPQTDTKVLADTLYALAINQQPGSQTPISMDALGALRYVEVTEQGNVLIEMEWGNPLEKAILQKDTFEIKKGLFVIETLADGTNSVKLLQVIPRAKGNPTIIEHSPTAVDQLIVREIFQGTPGTDVTRAQYVGTINTMLQAQIATRVVGIYPRVLDPITFTPKEVVLIRSVANPQPNQPATETITYTPNATNAKLWQTAGIPATEPLQHIIYHVLPTLPYGIVTGREYGKFTDDVDRLTKIDTRIEQTILAHPLLTMPDNQLLGLLATLTVDEDRDVRAFFGLDDKRTQREEPLWRHRLYTQDTNTRQCLINAFNNCSHLAQINWNLNDGKHTSRQQDLVIRIENPQPRAGEQETFVAIGMHPENDDILTTLPGPYAPEEIYVWRRITDKAGQTRIVFGGHFVRPPDGNAFTLSEYPPEITNVFYLGDRGIRQVERMERHRYKNPMPPATLPGALAIISESIVADIKHATDAIMSDPQFNLNSIPTSEKVLLKKIPLPRQKIDVITDQNLTQKRILAGHIRRLAKLPTTIPLDIPDIVNALLLRKFGPYYEFMQNVRDRKNWYEPLSNATITFAEGDFVINPKQ